MTLAPGDFAAFFQEVYGHGPFPWQERLLGEIVERSGKWPDLLDLPTGSGKTAAIDIAVFHLALEAGRGEARRAPVRIAFVVDRRLVVDDAFERTKKLESALAEPKGRATAHVAERLKKLSGEGPPLIARRLRGGIPREDDWARTPSQPTVLCSTVDQVGSRLLFRGYGVSDSMKPVHAGLIGSDCLILLDEAHLAEPFRQTLGWLKIYQGQSWRETNDAAPLAIARLSATPGEGSQDSFSLGEADKAHPVLKKRLNASKPARLVAPTKPKAITEEAADSDDKLWESGDKGLLRRATAIVKEVRSAFEYFKDIKHGVRAPAIGIVVNRVVRARTVFKQLRKEFNDEIEGGAVGEPILMIGPARPLDRDELTKNLGPIRTQTCKEGQERILDKPLVIVATQCIEAGVDIDLDALITEAAPLDALRQRFGRLNRAGRNIEPYAAIIAAKSDLSARHDDPVYGKAIKPAWDHLREAAQKVGAYEIVDFGLSAFAVRMDADVLAPKADAPVLLPAHLDLLSQTAPIPAANPDIALYLHGPSRQPDSITIIWRADIDPENHRNEETCRLLTLVPPRSGEAIELPIWAVRCWLTKRKAPDHLADVPAAEPEEESRAVGGEGRKVFRWTGDNERSRWIAASELRPGDTVVVPARYGGVDDFGWNPESDTPVEDIGRKAAAAFARRRFPVRVAPGLVGDVSDEALADALAGAPSRNWRDLRAALLDLALPETIETDLKALDNAKANKVGAGKDRRRKIDFYTELYGEDAEGRWRGVVFVAPLGVKEGKQRIEGDDGQPNATEDDAAGSMPGFRLTLAEHNQDVGNKAETFARAAGLPEARVADLKLAGHLHDAGKADSRFQAWLNYGDPLRPDAEQILAKSGRRLPRAARDVSGLPDKWRHEALSVRLARADKRCAEANDPELILWLIGTHHGQGRPLFPHRDPKEKAPDVGPQSLAFDWNGLDWPSLFAQLKARYGVWELARMEAILRLADHRASEERAAKETS
ncbi:MAG: type I-U CRISPR-associated helicase/endonuclease Cas3 [Xanthobacteraceae bacterium]